MILKQNAFIISDNELNALEQGTYIAPQRLMKNDNGIMSVQSPITYTGSSIQRRNYKTTKTIKKDKTENLEWELSSRSKTKIGQKILAWSHATKQTTGKPRFTFLTTTLTSKQLGSDSDYTKMQNVFFTYCRKYFGTKKKVKNELTGKIEIKSHLNYLYVLEKQTKTTNNLHSHVMLDKPLPIVRLNYIWCKILSDKGYTFNQRNKETGRITTLSVIEAYKNAIKSPRCTNIEDYLKNPQNYRQNKPKAGYLLSSPNPVDIKFIYNLKAVSQYITKYITKSETKINTTVWNCSESISRLWVGAKISALDYYAQLNTVVHKVIRQVLDEGYVLNICLLKYYTKIQQTIFSELNSQYLIT